MNVVRVLATVGLVGLSCFAATRAKACGVSATGVPFCSLAEHDEAERPRWAIGVSSPYTSARRRSERALRCESLAKQ
jgi:hypothetical protein